MDTEQQKEYKKQAEPDKPSQQKVNNYLSPFKKTDKLGKPISPYNLKASIGAHSILTPSKPSNAMPNKIPQNNDYLGNIFDNQNHSNMFNSIGISQVNSIYKPKYEMMGFNPFNGGMTQNSIGLRYRKNSNVQSHGDQQSENSQGFMNN